MPRSRTYSQALRLESLSVVTERGRFPVVSGWFAFCSSRLEICHLATMTAPPALACPSRILADKGTSYRLGNTQLTVVYKTTSIISNAISYSLSLTSDMNCTLLCWQAMGRSTFFQKNENEKPSMSWFRVDVINPDGRDAKGILDHIVDSFSSCITGTSRCAFRFANGPNDSVPPTST